MAWFNVVSIAMKNQPNLTMRLLVLNETIFRRFFSFQGGSPLEPPFVARFGILPSLSLCSNGRLSVLPCTRGASKGIHALESVASCQLSQPKQMRRNGYLHLIWRNSVWCFVFVIEKVALDSENRPSKPNYGMMQMLPIEIKCDQVCAIQSSPVCPRHDGPEPSPNPNQPPRTCLAKGESG